MDHSRKTSDAKHTERPAVSRRALLKGSVVSMPAILTLQSGAALARSSNLISGTSTSYTDAQGRALCLDVNSVYPAGEQPNVYDLSEPPFARVTRITDRDYRIEPRGGADQISEAGMCDQGGIFYYKGSTGPYAEVNVPRGMLVSATSLSSFAGHIVYTDL